MAEGKVALGSIYRGEAAFFAEHGVYGSNLRFLGLQTPEVNFLTPPGGGIVAAHSGNYSSGFFSAGCFFPAPIAPSGTPGAVKLASVLPEYYDPNGYTNMVSQRVLFVPSAFCRIGSVANDGSSFTAAASAVISPAVSPTTSDSSEVDQWTIDHSRNLSHVVDGTK